MQVDTSAQAAAGAVASAFAWPGLGSGGALVLALAAALLAAVAGALWLLVRQRGAAAALRASLNAATLKLDDLLAKDPLTGLITRPAFEQALGDAVVDADRGRRALCVLHIGVDHFRAVNDAFGHDVGDIVLRQVAARLELLRPGAPLARLGGDEFVLLLRGDVADARTLAQRAQQVLARPLQAGAHELRIGASIGIAAYPEHGSRLRLIAHAGAAMRSAKRAGGGAHAEYDGSMGVDARRQAELLHDLRLAVERSELQLMYQPKVDARTLQVTAAEALVRWHHPQRGVVSPELFIPLAERHGLIGAIGDWVLEEACRQAAAWRGEGLRMRVAINFSGYQLRRDDLVERLGGALQRHALVPSRFTVEITESVAMEDTQVTRRAFERLGELGVHVSIDDFGVGVSSLASLRRLPAAELKIDKAFITDLTTSEDARTIVQAIVQMAHTLDLRVVAEGVETEGQRDLLVAMGCDELQGFLFARPMSAAAVGLWAADDDREGGHVDFSASLFAETQPAELN